MRSGFALAVSSLAACSSPAQHAGDAGPPPPAADVFVLTQHNDNARTGANLAETTLDTTNVRAGSFGKLFTRAVDGDVYAQPLYVPHVDVPGQGTHPVVFVATEHNSVYAYDAVDPALDAPLWSVNLGTSLDFNQDLGFTMCPPNIREIGITASPVIDIDSKTIWVVAKTKEPGPKYHQFLHALDFTTGAEKPGSPVEIFATMPGMGDGSLNGVLSFDPLLQLNRASLLLSHGVLYLAFASHCDFDPYHGWVLAYDAKTLAQLAAWNDTPSGGEGGIWQAGQGLSADDPGDIYFLTGNGSSDAQLGGDNYGSSFVKLTFAGGALSVADWFMPYNVDDLNSTDDDLGSSGALLIPGTNLLAGGGKRGVLYLLARDKIGHFSYGGDTNVLESFQATGGDPSLTHHIHGSPIYWQGPSERLLYVWGENDYLKAFYFDGRAIDPAPRYQSQLLAPPGMPGGMLSLSADGARAGSGIVWAALPLDHDAGSAVVDGQLRAFDAEDVSRELWSSENADGDRVGKFAKFCSPTIAGGRVYLATFSNQILVYGLLNP